MGPCVRLIRALVAQPQPELTEEESQKEWEEFKNTAKGEPWYLIEQRINVYNTGTRQSGVSPDYCFPESTNISIKPLIPSLDDDETLTGSTTLIYPDGTTEKAEVVHNRYRYFPPATRYADPNHKASNSVDTTILTSTKEIRLLSGICTTTNPKSCFKGTSITTASDGTQKLASVNIPPYNIPPKSD